MAVALERQTVTPFSALELTTGTPLYGGTRCGNVPIASHVEGALRRTAKALGLRLSDYWPVTEDVLRVKPHFSRHNSEYSLRVLLISFIGLLKSLWDKVCGNCGEARHPFSLLVGISPVYCL